MTSAANAVEKAVYDALVAEFGDDKVFQHAPEDTPADGAIIIGDLILEEMDTKGDADRTGELEISSEREGEQRKPVNDIHARIEAALSVPLTVDEWTVYLLSPRTEVVRLGGNLYVGASRFTVFALQ